MVHNRKYELGRNGRRRRGRLDGCHECAKYIDAFVGEGLSGEACASQVFQLEGALPNRLTHRVQRRPDIRDNTGVTDTRVQRLLGGGSDGVVDGRLRACPRVVKREAVGGRDSYRLLKKGRRVPFVLAHHGTRLRRRGSRVRIFGQDFVARRQAAVARERLRASGECRERGERCRERCGCD